MSEKKPKKKKYLMGNEIVSLLKGEVDKKHQEGSKERTS